MSSTSKGRDYISILCLDNKYIRSWQFFNASTTNSDDIGTRYNQNLSGSGILTLRLVDQGSTDNIYDVYFYPFELGFKKCFFKKYGVNFDVSAGKFVDSMRDWDAYWILKDVK